MIGGINVALKKTKIIQGDIYSVASSNIKKYRKRAGLSSEELAERVGIQAEYMRRIEAPKYKGGFTIQIVYEISVALDILISMLFKE